MTLECEVATNINGEDYWTVKQFSKLTEKEPGTIRVLISKGNRLRKLNIIHVGGKPFIEAQEIFNFPFVITGRPAAEGIVVEKFAMEDGRLVSKEVRIDDA